MKSHHYLICIGSNSCAVQKMEFARTELAKIFPDIVFGPETETDPLFFTTNRSLFHNQLCSFHSEVNMEKIKISFKEIERKAGRIPQDKIKEIVKLDIDLLVMDNVILKPKDMQREYIREDKKELGF